MVTIRTLKLRRLGRLAGSAFFGGGSKLRNSRHVDYRPAMLACTVSSDRPFPYQVDGDFLGHVRSLEFRYEPDALRLIVP
jgi:diacylglycerol kinase family enzyme